MSYTTSSGTTDAMAADYVGEDAPPEGVRRDSFLRDAERIVASIAPPPDPVTDAYNSAASDAEMRVFSELANERGRVKSESVSDISVSYAISENSDLWAIVRQTMAAYIPKEPDASNVAYVSSWPIKRS